LQLQHERHVLEKQPARAAGPRSKTLEDLAYESGLHAGNASGSTGLAEILTRKSRGDQVGLGESTELCNVGFDPHSETPCQDMGSGGVDLADHRSPMARLRQA
jgi:hypothetical protein